ncbi:MAG: UDP-3-O-(3-hydroxymyristoyl)glucosamine N-acyltransferase [Fibrobacter sp.]|nr:UDP-3-O-(3-hydroxymyristoyl)glucosamine N-acyltransferase [Fibrobacter sp.]
MEAVKISAIINFLEAELALDGGIRRQNQGDDFFIDGFSSLECAGPSDVSFWSGHTKNVTNANGYSQESLNQVRAGVLFVPFDTPEGVFVNVKCVCEVQNTYHAMVTFLNKFAVEQRETYMHPSVVVGPGCVIMPGAVIGKGCVLEANVTIYPNVVIGEGCVFQAGAVIGSRGFGFYEYQGKRRMVPHFAGVRIGDHCSFGANTVVAAGFVSPTMIGNNCHFDSMVQIGHNCVLHDNIYMASQSALGGSTIVESGVDIAGGAKAAGHLTIGKGAVITAKAGVTKSVPPGRTVAGFPAVEVGTWRRSMVYLRQIGKKGE